jgi:prephenate dehydrogenase
MNNVLIVGTGLIGSSVGLALKAAGFTGNIIGWDANPAELFIALERKAVDRALSPDEPFDPNIADVFILATPVLPILHWMDRLAPSLHPGQLVTDVGSTKVEIARLAATLYNGPQQARFLPGHPMAGKESGGAALADATLFQNATWLFTPIADEGEVEQEWRNWVAKMGANIRLVDPERHDQVCAWVSHLPQMLSTALAALLEDTFGDHEPSMQAIESIGGRALRETTRLGASPYSMWRDVALTNTENVAATLFALEQRLAHIRENLRTPELRDEFALANRFRSVRKTE